MSRMVIGLASGSLEKLVVASTLTGGAVRIHACGTAGLIWGAGRPAPFRPTDPRTRVRVS